MKEKTKNEAIGCLLAVVLLIGVFGIITGVKIGYAKLIYGDWKCAFAQCRLQK